MSNLIHNVRTVDPIRRGLRRTRSTVCFIASETVRTVDPIRRGLRRDNRHADTSESLSENR